MEFAHHDSEFQRLRFEKGGEFGIADEMKDRRRSSGVTFRRGTIHDLREGEELFHRLRISAGRRADDFVVIETETPRQHPDLGEILRIVPHRQILLREMIPDRGALQPARFPGTKRDLAPFGVCFALVGKWLALLHGGNHRSARVLLRPQNNVGFAGHAGVLSVGS